MKKNPVQKNLWKFNKKKIQEDKTKYQRKSKHKPSESMDKEDSDQSSS